MHGLPEEMGFELFPEIFDYSFDQLPHGQDRIDAIISQLEQLQTKFDRGSLDVNLMYKQLLPKLQKNYKRLYDIVVNREGMPDIITNNPDIFHGEFSQLECVRSDFINLNKEIL